MKTKKYIVIMGMVVTMVTQGMQKEKERPKEHPVETMVRGGMVGVAEGVTGVPCSQVKVHLQAKKPLRTFPVRHAFRGFGVNAFAAGPATLVQYGVNDGLNPVVGDDTAAKKCGIAVAAGWAGAVVATPSEALVMRAMNSDKSFVKEGQSIAISHGIRNGVFRGFVPTGSRDMIWAIGYFAAPKDTAVETVATGVGVAAVSHPLDVVKTRMQRNLNGGSFVAVGREVAKEGMRAAFAGVAPRAVRIVLALFGMKKADKILSDASQKVKDTLQG